MKKQARRVVPFKFFSIAVMGIALALSLPVLAQQKGGENRQDQSQTQSKSMQKQQDQAQYQYNQQRQRQNVSKEVQLDPMGWVTVGYDYNNDGIYDAFEIISVYDLQKRKRQLPDIASAQPYRPQQRDQQDTGRSAAANRQKHMVEGNIIKLQTVGIANSDRQHVIAKVNTERDTIANVDLGPKENLGQLDVQQGSHIKVFGVEGTIDKNDFLMADRLQVDGQRISIDRKEYRPLKKYDATVLSTRTLENKELKNTLARVKLEDGLKTIVNLGPANDLPNLSEGQQVQFLARITEVKGQKALIADSLLINGKIYQIDWDKVQKRSQQASG